MEADSMNNSIHGGRKVARYLSYGFTAMNRYQGNSYGQHIIGTGL